MRSSTMAGACPEFRHGPYDRQTRAHAVTCAGLLAAGSMVACVVSGRMAPTPGYSLKNAADTVKAHADLGRAVVKTNGHSNLETVTLLTLPEIKGKPIQTHSGSRCLEWNGWADGDPETLVCNQSVGQQWEYSVGNFTRIKKMNTNLCLSAGGPWSQQCVRRYYDSPVCWTPARMWTCLPKADPASRYQQWVWDPDLKQIKNLNGSCLMWGKNYSLTDHGRLFDETFVFPVGLTEVVQCDPGSQEQMLTLQDDGFFLKANRTLNQVSPILLCTTLASVICVLITAVLVLLWRQRKREEVGPVVCHTVLAFVILMLVVAFLVLLFGERMLVKASPTGHNNVGMGKFIRSLYGHDCLPSREEDYSSYTVHLHKYFSMSRCSDSKYDIGFRWEYSLEDSKKAAIFEIKPLHDSRCLSTGGIHLAGKPLSDVDKVELDFCGPRSQWAWDPVLHQLKDKNGKCLERNDPGKGYSLGDDMYNYADEYPDFVKAAPCVARNDMQKWTLQDDELPAKGALFDLSLVNPVLILLTLALAILVLAVFILVCLCKRRRGEEADDDYSSVNEGDSEDEVSGTVKPGMISARFDGGPVEQLLREVHHIVAKLHKLPLRMVDVKAGESFGDQTLKYLSEILDKQGIIFAACTSNWGEKTKSSYSSHEELKYIAENDLRVVPLIFEKPYPPQPPGGRTHPHDKENMAKAYIRKVFKPSLLAKDCANMNAVQLADFIEQCMRSK